MGNQGTKVIMGLIKEQLTGRGATELSLIAVLLTIAVMRKVMAPLFFGKDPMGK